MKRLCTLVTFSLLAGAAYAQPGPDVRILSEDARSLVIEFVPVFSSGAVLADNGRQYTRFRFQNAIAERGEQGSPILPYRATLINLPSRQFTLQVIATEFSDLAGVQAATHPILKPDRDFGLIPVYTAPKRDFVSNDLAPVQIAELADVGESRGLIIGTLRLYPVQVSLGRSLARVYSRIVVRIEFSAGGVGLPGSLFLKNEFPTTSLTGTVRQSRSAVSDSPLAQGEWYKMEVKESGIYRIDQDLFAKASIPLSSIGNIRSVRIFGNGAEELSENLLAPRANGLEEIPRLVVDKNGNGTLDPEDFILFYGKSTRGWKYDPAGKTFNHYINHYTETSNYFLTFGGTGRGRDMSILVSTNDADAYRPPDFQGRAFVENELENLVNSGRQWIGQSFDVTTKVNVFTTSVPGVVSSKPMIYRFVFLSRSTSTDTFRVQENNQFFGDPILMYPINVSSIENDKAYQTPVETFQRTGDIPNDRSVLRITFGTGNSAAQGWIDWFEILFRQRFEAINDFLLFASPDTTVTVEYSISKLSSRDVYVFDVGQHHDVKQMTNLTFDPADVSACRFQAAQSAGSVHEFAVVGPTGYKTPTNIKRISNSNLHGNSGGAEFVIIAPQEFLTEADRLKAHRERYDQLKTLVVNVEQIFNEFSVGMPDPMAIRDFLKYADTTWATKPQYVLFFGRGNFDYKNIKSTETNWILPYESMESLQQIETLASDDYFVMLDPHGPRISIATGRLPVRSANEAKDVVDKIIAYETSAPLDSWRNRITFVGDDGLTSTGDDGSVHTAQSEELAQLFTPASFQKDKIYIVQYPTVSGSTGRRKPTANEAIVEAINRGTLILNFTGHGNTEQWAHEKIFAQDEDFAKLKNAGKPFFLVAATCAYAVYDYPFKVTSGEQLLVMAQNGAIGVVTACRAVYSGDNAFFNRTLYGHLFQRDAQGRPVRLGDAMYATKQLLFSTNDLKYNLLGDPTMRLAIPRDLANVDSINGQSATRLITVGALGQVRVKGNVKGTGGSSASTFTGRALLEAYDSKKRVVVPEWGDYSFELAGSLIYRGEISVKAGVFEGTFPIPKDVSYDDNRSRIALYAWSDSTDASGYSENISIAGTAPAAVDTVGPQMTILLEDPSFRPGDVVKPDATLIVDLVDASGINTSTAGIGHRLEATLDNSAKLIDLTNFYRGNLDTYQSGQVRYQFAGLAEGRHSVAVKAWDIHNNSSLAETYFEVRSESQLSIYNVFNFPNPFGRSTTFTFQRNSTDPIDIEVKIYTVAGRLIQTIESPSVVDRFVQIPWDGRDRDGSELANGVYLYKVIAKSLDRTSTSEALGKLSVLR